MNGNTSKVPFKQYLAFQAGGELFGIPVDRVFGAARPRRITPIPGAPPEYAGLALVRGEPYGVLDAARALGAGTGEKATIPSGGQGGDHARPLIILLENDSRALLVDRIDSIEDFRPETVAPAPEAAKKLLGLVPMDGRFLGLVNLDALLNGGKS
jgi:chemotaxis signal transduction protein